MKTGTVSRSHTLSHAEVVRFKNKREESRKTVNTNFIRQRPRKSKLQGTPQDADTRYRDILERTVQMIRRIPDYEDACAVLAKFYPHLFHELIHVGLERLNAGVGVVRVERFQEICDEYVDRWIEVVGLTISPELKLARGAAHGS